MSAGRRLQIAFVVFFGLNLVGAIGFRLIEGWSWIDSFYMTFMTLSTVGFGEVDELSAGGRLFTMVLFWTTASVIGVLITTIGQALVQSELYLMIGGRRRMLREIARLEDHYIICGAGRIGRQVIEQMRLKARPHVVIEHDEHMVERLIEDGSPALCADASEEEVLVEAGIERARGVVCCLGTDPHNLYVVLTARTMNPRVRIVTRADDEAAIPKMRRAGADKVVSPVVIGSHRIAEAVLRPAVSDFIELATMAEGLELTIEQVEVSAESPLVGVPLRDTGIRQRHNVIVIAIKRQSEMLFNPSGELALHAGDLLVAVGKMTELEALGGQANPSTLRR